jgi:hypothetical protein
MDQQEIKDFLLNNTNCTEDRYGNLRYTTEYHKEYRLVFKDKAVRFETSVLHEATQYSPASKSWIKLDGAYYKDIIFYKDGRLKIGKKLFGKKPDASN